MARKILTSNANSNGGNMHYYHLPMGLVTLTIRRTSAGEILINDPVISYLPDPNARYFFSYQPSAFTDDDITIEFNEEGFLSRMHTMVDDQIDDVITKTFELGTAIVEGVAGLGGMKTRQAISEEKILFSSTIDPFNELHIAQVNKALKAAGEETVFSVDPLRKGSTGSGNHAPQYGYGIYSRPKDLFNLSLTLGEDQVYKTVSLPNPNETHFIEIPSPGMVKTEFQIKFNPLGYPTYINIKKPSTALALIQLPLTIIRAIIELPTRLIQLRVNLDSNNAKALQNELSLRKIQKEAAAYYDQEGKGGGQTLSQNQSETAATRNIPQNTRGGVSEGKLTDLENSIKLLNNDVKVVRERSINTRIDVDNILRKGNDEDDA